MPGNDGNINPGAITGSMYKALSIAGSDSVGGAGIQADLKAFASLGVHGCCAITAVTAQSSTAVDSICAVEPSMLRAQMESVLEDVDIGAAKTGMLYMPDSVEAVAEVFEDREIPLVVDPVLVAGVGDSLGSEGLAKAIMDRLLPLCDMVTPNRHEAETMAGMEIIDGEDAMTACEIIGSQGSSVYLKGGHIDSLDVVDYLYHGSEFTRLRYPRLPPAGHGGGCVLSAYMAANMAKGMDAIRAALTARESVQGSIVAMYTVGRGVAVVDPLVDLRRDAAAVEVLQRLRVCVTRLEETLPASWLPAGGGNLAFALPFARGPEDIAGLEPPMMAVRGRPRAGAAAFGAADDMAEAVLAVMGRDPWMRAAVKLAHDDDRLDLMEELGLTVSAFERGSAATLARGMEDAIDHCDEFPDVVLEQRIDGGEVLRLLGRSPEELLQKIALLL